MCRLSTSWLTNAFFLLVVYFIFIICAELFGPGIGCLSVLALVGVLLLLILLLLCVGVLSLKFDGFFMKVYFLY